MLQRVDNPTVAHDAFGEAQRMRIGDAKASVVLPPRAPNVPIDGPVPNEVKQQMVDYILKLSDVNQYVAVWVKWQRQW